MLNKNPLLKKEPEQPAYGKILGYDHITFWVGNAKQAASFYTSRFGFDYYAYKGLQSGERMVVSHAVRNKQGAIFVFCSVYNETSDQEMNDHLTKHGDGVRDVAFTVENSKAIYERAIKGGAHSILEPIEMKDQKGSVVLSSVKAYGDTIHTFVERKNYQGCFLPGFVPHHHKQAFNSIVAPIEFNKIDHLVGNQPLDGMQKVVKFYEDCLDFHRFWSVDDKAIHSQFTALRFTVVSDYNEVIKMPINQPACKGRKSQIQQYVDYYHDAGVQHIALNTDKIIDTVTNMRNRGVEFLNVPDTYYDILRRNLPDMNVKVSEDVDHLQKNKILIDYDDHGYLLQIFTKPVEDRPTLFFEIIQRNNHDGFGIGNIKSLFLAIEEQQKKRGNLI